MDAIIENKTSVSFSKMLIPIISSVFLIYLTIGIMMGTIPQFVQNHLKYNSIIVGLVIGLDSVATLLTRAYAGKLTDTKGAKLSSRIGSVLVIAAGAIYLLGAFFYAQSVISLATIIVAVIAHGTAESFFVTGSLTWGIGLVGVEKSGKVMTLNGIAMYAGIALGAPLGIALNKIFGVESAFLAISVLAILSVLSTNHLPKLAVNLENIRAPFYNVIRKIANEGLGLAFSSIGFACISSFVVLFFTQKNWGDASLAFMMFGGFYILMRIFFSSYPDKYGAYKVAVVSLLIELIGQLLIGFATTKWQAIMGCCLTGAGFSLIFPSLGVLAIKKVSPQMRGTALGAYGAFFDLSLGIAAPIAGLVAGWFNYQSVYTFGGVSCILALIILLKEGKKVPSIPTE